MSDAFEEQGWVQLGVAAALSKEYEADQRAFLAMLAETLEKALPGEAKVSTQGWFSNKHIVKLEVQLGDALYGIEDPGRGPLLASKKKIVRGIALKTELVSVEQCLAEISSEIESRAKRSADARNAIANLLGLS